jgi:peptidoglycan/LPS O-acetylase OafA/YrhL
MSANDVSSTAGGHEGRIPGLDGLRGLAAVGIVMVHSAGMPGFPANPEFKRLVGFVGGHSVPLFFVLSGYLITRLLLKEEMRNGRISLKNFYARRALRILPAAMVYLGTLAILSPLLGLKVKAQELLASAFWYRNFLYNGWAAWANKLEGGEYFTGHYWSLSVEEHFYFIWPLLLLLVPRKQRIGMLLLPLLLLPVWRMYNLKISGIGGLNYWRTDLISDYLLMGALMAVLEQRWSLSAAWTRFWASWWLLPVSMLAINSSRLAYFIGSYFAGMEKTIRWTAVSTEVVFGGIGLVLLVGVAVHGRRFWLDAWLNSRPMVWLGAISFSLYLWQQPFCETEMRFIGWSFPLNLLGAFGAAIVSHSLVERPFLRLRHRFR